MKSRTLLTLLLLLPASLSGAQLRFHSPTFEEPHYRMLFQIEFEKDSTIIEQLYVNARKVESFVVFAGTKRQQLSEALTKGTYDVVVDYAWESGKSYEVAILCKQGASGKTRRIQVKGSSPNEGGIPAGREGFYRIFTVEENIGLERSGEIVYLTITAPKERLGTDSLLILVGNSPVNYQVLERKANLPPEKVSATHPVTNTFKVALPLDIEARGKKLILVLLGEMGATIDGGFRITGEGLGKTVGNGRVTLEFHPKSGQINVIEYPQKGIRLWNEIGVIHWNPGCFIPGIAWDHSFNWDPPEHFEEKAGAFVYLNSRKGPLPNVKDVYLEVKYTLEARAPYFVSETRMRVEKDLGVVALRNDEMVFYNKLFDSLIYKNPAGEIVKMPLREIPRMPYGIVHVAADNLDWVGLLNTERGFGFFSLRIRYVNYNLDPSGDFLHKAGTYFYAPSDGHYVYWVRPLVYTWSEYTTANLLTFVPKGSSFYEKNAYMLLPLSSDFSERIDSLLRRLKNPLRVY